MKGLHILAVSALIQINLSGQGVAEMLQSQNFDEIGQMLSANVELKVGDDNKVIGAAPVLSKLEEKLKSFQPTKVKKNHNGTSDIDNSDYIITKLYNEVGEGLRIFVYINEEEAGRKISDIKVREL